LRRVFVLVSLIVVMPSPRARIPAAGIPVSFQLGNRGTARLTSVSR
jgi:hypothetical protein